MDSSLEDLSCEVPPDEDSDTDQPDPGGYEAKDDESQGDTALAERAKVEEGPGSSAGSRSNSAI